MTSIDLKKLKDDISEILNKFDNKIIEISKLISEFKNGTLNPHLRKKRKHFPFSQYMEKNFDNQITEYTINKVRFHFDGTKLDSKTNEREHSVLNSNYNHSVAHSYSLLDSKPEQHKKLLLNQLNCMLNRLENYKEILRSITMCIDDILNETQTKDVNKLHIYQKNKEKYDASYETLLEQVVNKTDIFNTRNSTSFEYVSYINYIPVGSFIDENGGKVKIANCYVLACDKKNIWNILFDYYEPFVTSVIGMNGAKSTRIKEFNNLKNANINNMLNIIQNSSSIIQTYYTSNINPITREKEYYKISVGEIDSSPKRVKIDQDEYLGNGLIITIPKNAKKTYISINNNGMTIKHDLI